MFNSLRPTSPAHYGIYKTLVEVAGANNMASLLVEQLDDVADWLREWGVTAEAARELYRALESAFVRCGQMCGPVPALRPHPTRPPSGA